ncbi:MAG: hypothetical protein FJ406_12515 [Verrucomicrobia bacterium]|nr:hypothetical protein [Verrucomicrobiota bacterium]
MKRPHWSGLILALAVLVCLTSGCRRRAAKDAAAPASGGGEIRASDAKATPEGAAPLQGGTTMIGAQEATLAASHKAAVKPWSQLNAGEKEDSYNYWLHQHQFGDSARKAQILAEIRKANLSPVEFKAMHEMAARFGFAPIRF